MTMRDPAIGEILVQADDLRTASRQLGAEISRDYEGKDLLLIGVLKGAIFFLSRPDAPRSTSVRGRLHGRRLLRLGHGLQRRRADPQGPRHADRGPRRPDRRGHRRLRPHAAVPACAAWRRAAPRSLEVCALLTKPTRRKVDLPARYVGFEIPDRFAIGYGLDHAERYRNLPYVAALRRDGCDPRREGRPHTRRNPAGARDPLFRHGDMRRASRRLTHEPLLQERRLPDPDRDRAGVLRLQADLGLGSVAQAAVRRSSSQQIDDGKVQSVVLRTKDNSIDVTLDGGAEVPDRLPDELRAES